ncbi:MAG: choice-of-anchor D domain-containing protein, partial [Candidatus Kapaibacterium sp.]
TITASPATVTENRRDLHVTNVRITGPDASDFVITTAPLAFTMKPNEQKLINVEFHPQTPGKKYAFIQADGDQSLCDVVIDSLYGYTFTVGLETEGYDFGTNLTCNRPVGNITVKNTGSEPITVNNVKLVDSTDAFEILVEQLPFLLAPGEVKTIPATFHSPNNRTGSFGATVEFEAVDKDGKVVNVPSASLKGQMRILTVNAHINTDYRAYPGNSLTIPVTLDDNADQAQVTTLFISIRYDNRVLRMSNGSADSAAIAKLLKGTILEGWTVRIVEADHPEGEYLAIFTAPQGKFLKGSGPLLNLNFLTYLGAIDSSKLNLSILQVGDQQCVKVNSKPGLVRIDSVCGLNLRLIESTGFNYKLGQNAPNPFNPTTDITFSLGLDGHTTLEIYDAGGKQVGTLLNGYMKPGTYTITWDAKNQSSGLYYYRLQSGDWTQTNTMILRK